MWGCPQGPKTAVLSTTSCALCCLIYSSGKLSPLWAVQRLEILLVASC